MKQSQSGRSMVEILGVLSIMGVLSLVGISAYSSAMKKYRVNEILAGIRERALAISAYQGFGGHTATDLLEYQGQSLKGYSVALYNQSIEGSDFAIQIGNLSQEICEQVASQGLQSAVLVRPNLCDAEEDNIIIFGFKNDLAGKENQRAGVNELSTNPGAGQPSESCTAEGTIRCNAQNPYMVEKCKQDAAGTLYWTQKELCLYGCSGGICSSRACIGNAQKCWNDSQLLVCENGQWADEKIQCTAQCSNGHCGEDCTATDVGDPTKLACWVEGGIPIVYSCELNTGRYTYTHEEKRCTESGATCTTCLQAS